MIQKIIPSSGTMPSCEICGKEAIFQCSECEKTYYCSKEHQFQHWRRGHKVQCQAGKQPIDDSLKKILEVRKSYYENFSHKRYTESLLDAKVLSGLQRKRLIVNLTANNQLDYGATICLLVKTYLLLNDKKGAKQQIEAYLKEKRQFLEDLKDVPSLKQKESIKEKYHEHLQKKLNLISCIANLCYAIGIECISYYVLYTKVIMIFFGAESYEASNCYFLVGCYYAEEGYFKKGIQCFKKAASIRGAFAGDCLYNIGILYKMQGQHSKALEILEKSLKLRQEQYGEDSNKVAEIHQMQGIIYTELNDFKTAFAEYREAFTLRSNDPKSPEFENVLELIHQLYDKLCLFIDQGMPRVKKGDMYPHLKIEIQSEKAFWDEPKYKKKINQNQLNGSDSIGFQQRNKADDKKKDEQKQDGKPKFEHNMVLTEEFTSTLNLTQLFRLSELQLELQKCLTQFGVIYTIGTSLFFQNLSPEKYYQLEAHNKKLFELIKLEQLNKIKNTDK